MSSASSTPFSFATIPGERHTRTLKTRITIHILVLVTAIPLLMLLIWHSAAVEGIDDYDVPSAWTEMFLQQFFGGTKVFSWVAVYLFVPLDVLHALLCIGWYTDKLHPVRRERDVGRRRRATRRWLRELRQHVSRWWNRCLGHFDRSDEEEEDPSKSAPDVESQQQQRHHSSSHNRTLSHWANDSDTSPPPFPPSLGPHTYHPLLHPTYTPLTHHILLTLWDILILLTLASHVYVYTSNILSSINFCREHLDEFPFWHVTPAGKPFTLLESCIRINWTIHTAGGCSATCAMLLAVWHICAMTLRLWDVVYIKSGISKQIHTLKSRWRERRDRHAGRDVELLDWQYPPRDVDIRSRSTTRRSVRSGTQTGTQTGADIGQEEMGIGLARRRRRRRRRREGRCDASSEGERENVSKGSRWEVWKSEGFFECLA